MTNLGDFTQIPVTKQATQGLPAMGGTVTLYNQDLTNSVYISYQPWFAAGANNCIPIQPLGSVTVSAEKAIYVAALVTGLPNLLVLPEGTNVQPSPAQIAAQINALGLAKDSSVNAPAYGPATATGLTNVQNAVNAPAYSPITTANAGLLAKDASVTPLAKDTTLVAQTAGGTIANEIGAKGAPLLILNNNLQNTASATLAAAGTVTSASLVITQPSYHMLFGAVDNVAGTQHKTVQITLTWSDSTTGQNIQTDIYYMLPGITGGSQHVIVGDGPSKGDRVVISVTNNDTAAITYSLSFTQDSKVFTRDLWRSRNNPGAQGFTAAGSDLGAMILFDTSPTIAAGANSTRLIPLWTGQCSISMVPGSGASGAVTYQIWSEDPSAVNWQRPYTFVVTGGAVATQTSLILPNAQCFMTIINNGTGSAIMGAWITTFEQ